MCKKELVIFTTFTIICFVGIFVCCLLNLMFSINNSKYEYKNIFKVVELVDYRDIFYGQFLTDIEFGKELENKSDYNSSLRIQNICYIGKCILESKSVDVKNCSKACFEQSKVCFYGEEECLENKCRDAYWSYEDSECYEFNRIKKWRNTEMYNDSKIFEFIPNTQFKTKDEICDNGYRKCGIINKNEDFLCLKEDYSDFKCPINKIIILSNNKTPSDNFKYKKYKIGESKNIFITNENTNDYLISDLYINFDKDDDDSNFQLIDKDSYLNFSKYNKVSLEWRRESSSFSRLNVVQYHSGFTVNQMRIYQRAFSQRAELYTKEKLEEMNLKANSCKGLLLNLGVFLLGYYSLFANCMSAHICKDNNRYDDMTPMMYVIFFYIFFSPFILVSFISFIITIYKIFIYNKFSSMIYINEYKNFSSQRESYLDISIYYNKAQFINLLIIMLIIIFYPIIVKKALEKKNSPKGEIKIENITGCDSYNLCSNSDNYETPQSQDIGRTYQGETPYYQ